MRLIAKAALGALAFASLGFGISAPASAQSVIVTHPGVITTPVITTHRFVASPCARPVAFRPAFCFRSGRLAFLGRPSWRSRMLWRQHLRRQAMLSRRFGY